MKSPTQIPQLTALADACIVGACNPGAVLRSLATAIDELEFHEIKTHPAVKVVIGQVGYLLGEVSGPSASAWNDYRAWRKAA